MKKYFLHGIIGTVSGFINGMLGAGGGTIIVPSLERFLKVSPHKAHATAISVILPVTIISSYFYSRFVQVDKKTVVIIAAAGMAGGFAGAKFLKKLSGRALKVIFAAFMIIAGLRMLWA